MKNGYSSMHKKAYDAEGNKILVVLDADNIMLKNRSFFGEKLRAELIDKNLDTAMIIIPSESVVSDFKVISAGRDGLIYTEGMCGNGARSVTKYAIDYLGFKTVRMRIPNGEIIEGYKEKNRYCVRLNHVIDLTPVSIRTFGKLIAPEVSLYKKIHQSLGKLCVFDKVSFVIENISHVMQEPHVVVRVAKDVTIEQIKEVVVQINNARTESGALFFPQQVNVNFLLDTPPKGLDDGFLGHTSQAVMILTHERAGAGFTGACGTGSTCAAAWLFKKYGYKEIEFTTKQGKLSVTCDHGYYYLKGGAKEV